LVSPFISVSQRFPFLSLKFKHMLKYLPLLCGVQNLCVRGRVAL
jgi:hypothetical protein